MRCISFCDINPLTTIDRFNIWAAGKSLAKDVIVHSHALKGESNSSDIAVIMVFFDEGLHPDWVGKR